MRLRNALLIAAALTVLAAVPARADQSGWYVGAEGGWSKLAPMGSSDSTLNFTSEESNGFAALGFAGYDFGLFRAEGELGYRHHDVTSLTVISGAGSLNGASANPTGTVSVLSFMINGIVPLLPSWRVSPYIGAGVGGAHLSLNQLGVANTTISNDTDMRVAGQGIVGVDARVTPRISLALDYRYFLTVDPSFKDAAGVPFHSEYRDQNVMLRVTFHFGAPPPPPPPVRPAAAPMPAPPPVAPPPPPVAAAPAPPPLFLVFFAFDKATLTPEGAKVVEQAAAAYKAAGAARISVSGYTDLAGTAAYNLALSRRRADTVRRYLLKLGVPAAAIDEKWFGKTNPRVPTADGVREPQNRRVEIMLP